MELKDVKGAKNKYYNIQKNLIYYGPKSKPILIGATTKNDKKKNISLKDNKKFEERQKEKKNSGVLDDFIDLPEFQESVLNPDLFVGHKWTPELNCAFMEGGILSARDFVVVTNPEYYDFQSPGIVNNGTFWEMICLYKNGYVFSKDPQNNKMTATQGTKPQEIDLSMFDFYGKIVNSAGKEKTEIIENAYSIFQKDILDLENMLKK